MKELSRKKKNRERQKELGGCKGNTGRGKEGNKQEHLK